MSLLSHVLVADLVHAFHALAWNQREQERDRGRGRDLDLGVWSRIEAETPIEMPEAAGDDAEAVWLRLAPHETTAG